jgi:hypothetical protein
LLEGMSLFFLHINQSFILLLCSLIYVYVVSISPLCDIDNQYTKLRTKLKESGVAVDVVNFGVQQAGYKKHQLLVLLAAVNNNDNTRMLDLCGKQLIGSSIIPLVGHGETSLYVVYLLQGEYLKKAKNQCDKVHGDSNAAIGYFFRKQRRFEGRERYRVGDRRKVRDWDIGKDIPLDDDAVKDRYWDRGDTYGRKKDYRVRDDGRERYRVGDRRKLNRDDDAGKERYWDRGDSFHDLKPDGGIDDTRNRKRKRDDTGHDDGRERYRDRGDRYGRKRDYKVHDEGREIYRVGDGRIRAR